MGLDVLIEVVGVEWTEQAAGCPSLNPQHLPIVSVAHGARPSHFHQGIAVYKEPQLAGFCPTALFIHNSHVHLMRMDIQAHGTLVWPVAQEIPPNKSLNHFDLVFIGTLAGHTSFLPVFSYRPKRNAGNSAFSEFGDKVSIQVHIQRVKRDSSPLAQLARKVRLLIDPGWFRVQVAKDHGIVNRDMGPDWIAPHGILAGHPHQGCTGHSSPVTQNIQRLP